MLPPLWYHSPPIAALFYGSMRKCVWHSLSFPPSLPFAPSALASPYQSWLHLSCLDCASPPIQSSHSLIVKWLTASASRAQCGITFSLKLPLTVRVLQLHSFPLLASPPSLAAAFPFVTDGCTDFLGQSFLWHARVSTFGFSASCPLFDFFSSVAFCRRYGF